MSGWPTRATTRSPELQDPSAAPPRPCGAALAPGAVVACGSSRQAGIAIKIIGPDSSGSFGMAGVCGAPASPWVARRGAAGAPAHLPSAIATRANATSTFHVDHTRQIVHLRPVETVRCHPVTDRSFRPTSDSHLPRIEADMCIGGEYRLVLIPLWHNGFPGCDVSCCPVRRSAGRRGGTTSGLSRVVRASTTPSTVTPLAADMGPASPSSASRQARRCRSVSSRRCSVAPCPRRPVSRWGRRGVRMR